MIQTQNLWKAVTRLALTLVVSLALAAGLAAAAIAQDETPPDELVRNVAGTLLDDLNANTDVYQADPTQVEALVRRVLMPALDVEYSARLILGRAGRGATPEQIAAFADTVSNVLIERYASGMLEYGNREQLEVLPLRGDLNERATRVRTRVRMLNGNQLPVDYVFRRTDEGWKAFDVVVEGISYVTTYRNQIQPQVLESGIDAVTERLARGELELSE
ncbi:MAG: ABC transporter substrate-binding protein [Pseudomonadota bacterium]